MEKSEKMKEWWDHKLIKLTNNESVRWVEWYFENGNSKFPYLQIQRRNISLKVQSFN